MDYWKRKDELKRKARLHTAEMDKRYRDAIAQTVTDSIVYGGNDRTPPRNGF